MTEFWVTVTTCWRNDKLVQRISCFEGNLDTHHCELEHEDGNNLTSRLIKEFQDVYPKLTREKEEILRVLEYGRQTALRQNNVNDLFWHKAVDRNLSSDVFRTHISCFNRKINSGVITRQDAEKNGIVNSDVKQHFKRFGEKSSVMKFFYEKRCEVCFDSYQEVLKEYRHIVIPSCGHPLCCHCRDENLRTKPQCPFCNAKLNKYEFLVMKFDMNLQVLPQERQIFH